jgi:glycosyltransferase involved in cell wall biosynthesis
VSVLVLTKNEAKDLPGCLESVAWCDDIHGYDSGSTDNTADIARRFGAAVISRTYPKQPQIFGGDEAAQRNWGLRHIVFKHAWVLQLDADERCTPQLLDALSGALPAPRGVSAYRIERRDFLFGTWLAHVQASPLYLRLFQPSRVRYERFINPTCVVDGEVAMLPAHFHHFPFSKGMTHWLDRHNAYSSLEARQIIASRIADRVESESRSQLPSAHWWPALFEADFHKRRVHQKELFYRLPCRPLIRFAVLYLAKRGFLDGRAGLTYAVLQAFYEYMIVLKVRELDAAARRPTAASPSS